jgi:hypothetical protein
MTIGIVEASNRRALLLTTRAIKQLKEKRKETRAVMQRYEGASDLSEDEKTTYEHLTLSMVILNALSDQLVNHNYLPRSWDVFALGSHFDKHLTPLLVSNDKGELWVDYFDCDRPKDLLVLVAGESARAMREHAPSTRPRLMATQRTERPKPEPEPQETSLMDLIRMRMPSRSHVRYDPKRG